MVKIVTGEEGKHSFKIETPMDDFNVPLFKSNFMRPELLGGHVSES